MTNTIVMAGRLTANAETKELQNGQAFCNFTIANNRKQKDGERSTFIEVVLFGAYAKAMGQYLLKGTTIDVIGELVQESWENEEGQKNYRYKIYGKEIDFRIPKQDTKPQQDTQE